VFLFDTVYVSAAHISSGSELSKCYHLVDGTNYCFYTDGSALSWDEARDFCAWRNSTLLIITNENIERAFHRFTIEHSCSLIQSRFVWTDVRASPVNNSVSWRWIDEQPSGLILFNLLCSLP